MKMPIDIEVFKQETDNLVNGLYQSMDLGKNGQYDKAIESLTDVIISAGRLMQRDPAIGKLLRLDTTLLVAKGYQLKAYVHKMEAEPEHREQIVQEMGRIAQGDIGFKNPYFAEIADALREWEATSERGDFYTIPRED
jgi:hypothetical protein